MLQNNELTNVSETSGLKQSLLPLNSNDVKNNKSLVSSCEGREIESTNNYYSSEAENIKINVNIKHIMIRRIILRVDKNIAFVLIGNREKISVYSRQYNTGKYCADGEKHAFITN